MILHANLIVDASVLFSGSHQHVPSTGSCPDHDDVNNYNTKLLQHLFILLRNLFPYLLLRYNLNFHSFIPVTFDLTEHSQNISFWHYEVVHDLQKFFFSPNPFCVALLVDCGLEVLIYPGRGPQDDQKEKNNSLSKLFIGLGTETVHVVYCWRGNQTGSTGCAELTGETEVCLAGILLITGVCLITSALIS